MPESFDAPRETTEAGIPWDVVPSFPSAGFPEGPPRDSVRLTLEHSRALDPLVALRSD
jgi:hypothetical protein